MRAYPQAAPEIFSLCCDEGPFAACRKRQRTGALQDALRSRARWRARQRLGVRLSRGALAGKGPRDSAIPHSPGLEGKKGLHSPPLAAMMGAGL